MGSGNNLRLSCVTEQVEVSVAAANMRNDKSFSITLSFYLNHEEKYIEAEMGIWFTLNNYLRMKSK